MIKTTPKDRMVHGLVALTLDGSLTACGFVTAPRRLASVEVTSTGVKAADYSIEQGQQAAIDVRTQSVSAVGASWRFLQETGANIRRDLFLDDLSEDASPQNSDGDPILMADLD